MHQEEGIPEGEGNPVFLKEKRRKQKRAISQDERKRAGIFCMGGKKPGAPWETGL